MVAVDQGAPYTLEQAAAYAHCSPTRLRKLAARGEVPAAKIGRPWIFPRDAFQAWVTAAALERMRTVAANLRRPRERHGGTRERLQRAISKTGGL